MTTQANQSLFTQVTRRPCLQCLQVAIYITAGQLSIIFEQTKEICFKVTISENNAVIIIV